MDMLNNLIRKNLVHNLYKLFIDINFIFESITNINLSNKYNNELCN